MTEETEDGSAHPSSRSVGIPPDGELETFLRSISCVADSRLKVLICMHCEEVVDPEDLAEHLDSLRVCVPDLARKLAAVVDRYGILSLAHAARDPAADGEPAFGLSMHPGYRCSVAECGFATREVETLTEHATLAHGRCLDDDETASCSCTVQRLSHKTPYFAVRTCTPHPSSRMFEVLAEQCSLDEALPVAVSLPSEESLVPPLLAYTDWVSVLKAWKDTRSDRECIEKFCHLDTTAPEGYGLLALVRKYLSVANALLLNVDPEVGAVVSQLPT